MKCRPGRAIELWNFVVVMDSIYSFCFGHRFETDLDVVFDKNMIFLSFLLKNLVSFIRLPHIQVLIKKESIEQKCFFV